MEEFILQNIKSDKNVVLVGPTNSGKTYFVVNKLIPFLENNGVKVYYFNNCDDLNPEAKGDAVIVDETELLFDKEFLENRHLEVQPYYSYDYLEKVNLWHKKLSLINSPLVVIVTRNEEQEVDNIYNNYKKMEWNGRPVEIIKFNY